jgi:hypothetical protein
MEWKDCIAWLQAHTDRETDPYLKLCWKRLQRGDRTQDLQQTLIALNALQNDDANNSPEWEKAIAWLTWQRGQQSNLLIDMCWQQLETGSRTPELLELIRTAANAPPKPAQPAPVSIPEPPPPVSTEPPSTSF